MARARSCRSSGARDSTRRRAHFVCHHQARQFGRCQQQQVSSFDCSVAKTPDVKLEAIGSTPNFAEIPRVCERSTIWCKISSVWCSRSSACTSRSSPSKRYYSNLDHYRTPHVKCLPITQHIVEHQGFMYLFSFSISLFRVKLVSCESWSDKLVYKNRK